MILYYYILIPLQPATILVGQAVSPVTLKTQSRARQQAILGCGSAAPWGGQFWPQPAFSGLSPPTKSIKCTKYANTAPHEYANPPSIK